MATMSTLSIADGRLTGARWCPSPNFDERPPEPPSLIVVHNISLPPGCFGTGDVEALFCNRLDPDADPFYRQLDGLRVSSHLLIERSGALLQFVSLDKRAWHAGVSSWCGRDNCNDYSIGIELEGTDRQPYEMGQYRQLSAVIRALREHYPSLGPGAIVGHSDIAPGRKTDPGPAFQWETLRRLMRSGPRAA